MITDLEYTYDLECYPEFFSEISKWKDDSLALYNTLVYLKFIKARMVGFNNLGYDYPMLHYFISMQGNVTYMMMYAKSQSLIATDWGNNKNVIWEKNRHIIQIDLLKIHHFDNANKSSSLKLLEFNMSMPDIKDLPFPPGTYLTYEQSREVLSYNDHDVDATEKFFEYTIPAIEFRDKLSIKYGRDFTNHNDTKIGKDYFAMELEKSGIPVKIGGKTNQTVRQEVIVKEALLPYINFVRPEFQAVHEFFKQQVITQKDEKGFLTLKGVFKGVNAIIDGFQFDFGAGGIHGSLKNTIVSSSATHKLIDIDVASYYPSLAIANRLFPAHLSERFCDINLDIFNQRAGFTKKQPENGMLKLALNGVYGDSNQKHSFFYDTTYTCRITINGQLLLCMLAEQMMKIPGLTMIQINTDGMTYLCPNESVQHTRDLQKWWENLTKLTLEEVEYSKMYIRDVNNYMAEKLNGSVKRIGCYAHETAAENPATRELPWHKDFGGRVIAKAAEAALIKGVNVEQFIKNHVDNDDFMFRAKIPKSSYLEHRFSIKWGEAIIATEKIRLQNIIRYHPSLTGGQLVKVMPPTAKQKKAWLVGDHYKHKTSGAYIVKTPGVKPPSGMYLPVHPGDAAYIPERADNETKIEAHQLTKDCSTMSDFNREDLDYDYYIKEARKIVDPLFSNQI